MREGLIAVISVKLQEAQFEGQTKAKLGNTSIKTLVSGLVYRALTEYFEENPAVAKAILEKATQAAPRPRRGPEGPRPCAPQKRAGEQPDARQACRLPRERPPPRPNFSSSRVTRPAVRPSRGVIPTSRRSCRVGKMLNVEKARADRIYGNDKLMPVVTALGTGIGDEFDISKVPTTRFSSWPMPTWTAAISAP